MKQTATSGLMRTINRSLILDLIRREGPISRAELARRTEVSLSTVMRVTDELCDERLVIDAGNAQSTGGRPGSLVDFNRSGFGVVSIDLGGTKIYGAVTDLGGVIQFERSLPSHGMDSIEALSLLIEDLLKAPRPDGQEIMGIGVGAPGVTLPEGIVTLAPGLGWKDMPLKDILSERFNVPVFVENDVNLAALGESGYGVGQGVMNFISIFVGTGIGAGIIIDGALYRGHNFSAGEIGYLVPSTDSLGEAYAGFGALEDVASGTGIAHQAIRYLKEKGMEVPKDGLTSKDVFEACRAGESWACNIVDETVDYLTVAIANANALLDPELIVLSGGVMESADLVFEPVIKRLQGLMPNSPNLVMSSLGPKATVLGATMLVLRSVTESTSVQKLA